MSKELELLVQIIKLEVLRIDSKIDTVGIDWNKFRKLCAYHHMRFLVMAANKKQQFLPENLSEQYKKHHQEQTFQHLKNVVEIKRLYDIFIKAEIQPILLKGEIYVKSLFENQLVRESCDIDLLFKKKDAVNAMHILLEEGYSFSELDELKDSNSINDYLNTIVHKTDYPELHFEKKSYFIDLHWDLNYNYFHYQVDIDLLFSDLETIDFHGKEIKIANSTALFWSLVLHHGGKELWLKFKHIIDLLAFMERYKDKVNWDLVLKQSVEFNLSTILKTGFWHLEQLFDYNLPKVLAEEIRGFTPKKKNQIVKFWVKAEFWHKIIPRLKMEKIKIYSQDQGFTSFGYFLKIYHTYSIPHPLQKYRLYNFRSKWSIFNFLANVISYILRKIRVKY